MKKQKIKEGLQAQVNEDNLQLIAERQARKIRELEDYIIEMQRIGTKEEELRKRAESYKNQLIVYKGIVKELLDKLMERRYES